MIRLMLAALLAIGVHATLFCMEVPRSQPGLILRQSRTVSIDLVTFQKPAEKPVPPPPKIVAPRPAPKSKPKPVIKPVMPPPPVAPRPIEPELMPEPAAAATFFNADNADIVTQKAESAPNAVAPEKVPAGRAKQRPAIQTSIPRYDLNPPPHYPRLAERRQYTGTVILDVRVTAYGRVAQVRIAESSGYDILDQSALKSVQGWQFTPARQEDRSVEMWVRVPVRYELQ